MHISILLIFLMVSTSLGQLININCLRIGRPIISTSPPSSSGGTSVTWSQPMPNISIASLVLRGFIMPNAHTWVSYESKVVNFSETGAYVTFQSNFVYNSIRFDLIATSSTCLSNVEISIHTLTPVLLNVLPRSQFLQSFYLPSYQFDLQIQSDFVVCAYFQAIDMVTLYQQQINIRSKIQNKLLKVDIVSGADAFTRNRITKLVISMLIVKKSSYEAGYLHSLSYQSLNSGTLPNRIRCQYCIFGFFNILVTHITNSPILATISLSGSDYTVNQNLHQAHYLISCFLTCQSGFISYLTDNEFYCCNVTNCNFCSSEHICQTCVVDYGLLRNHCLFCDFNDLINTMPLNLTYLCSCFPCHISLTTMAYCAVMHNDTNCRYCIQGKSVIGGCTITTGCIQVTQVYSFSLGLEALCIRCDQDYTLINGSCLCKDQNKQIIDGRCVYSSYGCISASNSSNYSFVSSSSNHSQCLGCNSSFLLRLINNLCQCQIGYQIVNGKCKQICGDGLVLNLKCDDGNNIDGDGCSSVCGIEKRYDCPQINASGPSRCKYIGDINFNVSWMENTGQVGKGVIAFVIEPSIPNVGKMNYSQRVIFKVDNLTVYIKSWIYIQGEIQLFFDYYQTLQGRNASLQIFLDPQYFVSLRQNKSFSFVVDSRNRQLIITYIKNKTLLVTITLGLSLAILLLILLSSFFKPMLAIQTAVFNQLIFLLHFQTKHYTPTLSLLQNMSYVFGNFYYYFNQESNIILGKGFQQMAYSKQNQLVSMGALLGILNLLLGLYALCKVFFWKCANSNQKHFKSYCCTRFLGSCLKLIHRILFAFSLSFSIFLCLQSLDKSKYHSQNQTLLTFFPGSTLRIEVFLLVAIMFGSGLVQKKQTKATFMENVKGKALSTYKKAYLIFLISIICAFSLLILNFSFNLGYLVFSLSFLMLIFQCKQSPYIYSFHNFGCHSQLICILVFCFTLLLRDLVPSLATVQNDQILVQAVFGIIFINLVFGYIRFFNLIYLKCCKSQAQLNQKYDQQVLQFVQKSMFQIKKKHLKQKKIVKKEIFSKKISGMNRYTFEAQILKQKQTLKNPLFVKKIQNQADNLQNNTIYLRDEQALFVRPSQRYNSYFKQNRLAQESFRFDKRQKELQRILLGTQTSSK